MRSLAKKEHRWSVAASRRQYRHIRGVHSRWSDEGRQLLLDGPASGFAQITHEALHQLQRALKQALCFVPVEAQRWMR